MAHNPTWHAHNNLAGYEQCTFGRKVGHILRRHDGGWCALYDGVSLGAVPDPEQAKVIVQAAAEATR